MEKLYIPTNARIVYKTLVFSITYLAIKDLSTKIKVVRVIIIKSGWSQKQDLFCLTKQDSA